jgi:hypothetical protein
MYHRHLNTNHWTAATIDSVLERGDLRDWKELFSAVRANQEVAELVLLVATRHDLGGASILPKALVNRILATRHLEPSRNEDLMLRSGILRERDFFAPRELIAYWQKHESTD